MSLWKKAVLLHPLSGTEAVLLGKFEKKLAEKFGGKDEKLVSLHPLSAKKEGFIEKRSMTRLIYKRYSSTREHVLYA